MAILSIFAGISKIQKKASWILAIAAYPLMGSPWWCPVTGPSDSEGAPW